MKTRKLFSLLSASVLLLALLTSCEQGQGSANPQTPTQNQPDSSNAVPAVAPADGPSITTNGGEVIALSALEHQSDSAVSTVYYISDANQELNSSEQRAAEMRPKT